MFYNSYQFYLSSPFTRFVCQLPVEPSFFNTITKARELLINDRPKIIDDIIKCWLRRSDEYFRIQVLLFFHFFF